MGRRAEQSQVMEGNTEGPAGVFDLSGTTLSKYRLIEKVGQGGMAQVYRAYSPIWTGTSPSKSYIRT